MNNRPLIALSLLTLLLPHGAVAAPGEWSQWRGPERNGSAKNIRLPKTWPTRMPSPLWRSFVGEGFSSPVIADGRIFLMGRDPDGKETCLSFDARNGKRLWRIAYPMDFKSPDPRSGSGPKSTPTIDGDRVYMFGLGGMLHCLDVKTGKVFWKHDCAAEYWGVQKGEDGTDAWFPPCGNAASALVVGKQVILPVGGKKAGSVTAFDRDSGAVVWKALEERGSYASPMLADLAGKRQVVAFTGKRMVGVDAATKQLLWDHPFQAMFEQTIVTPVIYKDLVFICGELKPTVALQIGKEGDKVVSKVAWQNDDLRAYMTTPLVMKDHLVGLDHRRKRLVCVEIATGKTTWTTATIGDYASLVLADDRLLVLNRIGDLFVFEADPTRLTQIGKWKVSEAGDTWAHLALSGSRLYVKDKEHLLCFDLSGS